MAVCVIASLFPAHGNEASPASGSETGEVPENVLHWAGCGITKKAFMVELATAYERHSGVKIVVEGGGATRGIRDTASHKIDFGGSCRLPLGDAAGLRPHPEESGIRTVPIAWDALVVIVHKDNPIDSLSLTQLRDVLSGGITNWNEVGGPDHPIELHVRKGRISGVGHTVRMLLFGDPGQDFTAKAVAHESTGPLEKAIEDSPWAVGVTGVSSARKREVKMLQLAGVEPSYVNIKHGRYLLYRPLYLILPLPARDPRVEDFVRFATGIEGARVLRDMGTVPYRDAPQLVMRQIDELRKALSGGLERR
ncbi:MAG: phosphate ABC transporter substrate-binding protein [Gammaproteobacteria bacterium]|nr:phosphate ABC transporter substrate-binding protein [Gammaproteobacteria bacterium]MCP5138125.1 phosphate ABC transporter substrate-binding protein [Gammaproteobacteria bacterium]